MLGMKKYIISAFAMVFIGAVASRGQGFVNFDTRVPGGVDAPIRIDLGDGSRGPGPLYSAALYLVGDGGRSLTLVPDSLTTFGSGADAVYIVPKVVQIPGVPGGTSATFVLGMWQTAEGSFEGAIVRGQSERFTVIPSASSAFPADLPATLTGFNLLIPEPSAMCLIVTGAAGLLWWRRR